MKSKKDTIAVVGVGAAACAACCAGPVLGFLAAIGVGTAVGFALFGSVAVVIGVLMVAVVLHRRRRTQRCTSRTAVAHVDAPTVAERRSEWARHR